jgi:hypothetical protein
VLRGVRFRHGIWRDIMIYGRLRAEAQAYGERLPLRDANAGPDGR